MTSQVGTEANLNADTNFVNAVKVITRTSTRSLFASFLRVSTSDLSAEAIAYIGFAKELNPRDVDQPIAVCQDWLNPADYLEPMQQLSQQQLLDGSGQRRSNRTMDHSRSGPTERYFVRGNT